MEKQGNPWKNREKTMNILKNSKKQIGKKHGNPWQNIEKQ